MKKSKKPKKTKRWWVAVDKKPVGGMLITTLAFRTRKELVAGGYGDWRWFIVPIDVPVTK